MTNLNETMSTLSTNVNGINSAVTLQQLSTLIGKTVTWNDSQTNKDGTVNTQSLTGKVTGLRMIDNKPVMLVTSGNQTYQVSTGITQITE